jgi:hypothetical protein
MSSNLSKSRLNLLKNGISREKPAKMSSNLSKSRLNLLKNGISRGKPAKRFCEGLDKRCQPIGFSDKNLPKTCSKPGLNVHGTRIATKTQSVATGMALHTSWIWTKAREWRRSHGAQRNQWHCEMKIGLKRTIESTEKPFFIKWSHRHAPHTHFCTQIERRSPANCSVIFEISSSDREF